MKTKLKKKKKVGKLINLKDSYYWFEYGGKSIAEFKIKNKDKDANNNNFTYKWEYFPKKNKFCFPYHYILTYVDKKYGYFLIGGCDPDNCYQFKDGVITKKANMTIQRSFMSVISYDGYIFAIGGFDFKEKAQIGSIEIYNVEKDQWKNDFLKDLIIPRSQSSALLLNESNIYVFGNLMLTNRLFRDIMRIKYNKDLTSLKSRYEFKEIEPDFYNISHRHADCRRAHRSVEPNRAFLKYKTRRETHLPAF